MQLIKIKKEINGDRFEYGAFQNEEKLASISGRFQNQSILWLNRYESSNADEENLLMDEIREAFYKDCLENKSEVLIELSEKSQKAKYFMDQSSFSLSYVNYVFECDLITIKQPDIELELIPFNKFPLSEYQTIFHESVNGDPKLNMKGLTPSEFFDQEKRELEDDWDETLMYVVYHANETLGILSLRTSLHSKTNEKEGCINYLGLVPSERNKGLGKTLHLTGLHILKAIGCKSYYGGTTSLNAQMLKIFESNNCPKIAKQYCYKT